MKEELKREYDAIMGAAVINNPNIPHNKEALILALTDAEPEKMNWLMLNYLVQKMYDNVSPSAHKDHPAKELEKHLCDVKEKISEAICHAMTEEDIKCLICREAWKLINVVCKDDPSYAYKEFTELCMAMGAYSCKLLTDDEELHSKEAAIAKYAEMFAHDYQMKDCIPELPKVHVHH